VKNTTINLGVIRRIARALGSLNEKVVYVGGAVVSLYINDPAADDVRPTKDIDIFLQIASLGELESLRQQLIDKGFKQTSEDDVICRFRYDDIKVDVMAARSIGWAPANPWFEPGLAHLETREMEEMTIRLLPLSYFIATKYSAFKNRGSKDPRTSHDFEDITYILDNRTDLTTEILAAPEDVLVYLRGAFHEILTDPVIQEALLANLYYETQSERFKMIVEKLHQICTIG